MQKHALSHAALLSIMAAGLLAMAGTFLFSAVKYKSAILADVQAFNLPGRMAPLELGVIGMSFCLMSLLIPTSHDYKLFIHVIPFVLLLIRGKDAFLAKQWQTFAFAGVMGAAAGYLFAPRHALYPLRTILGDSTILEMKTPALIVLFFGYAYFAFKGRPLVGGAVKTTPVKSL